jgi:histone H2B
MCYICAVQKLCSSFQFLNSGTPASQQHLFALGSTLEDGRLLFEYGITDGALIMMRQESSSQKKKAPASPSRATATLNSFLGVQSSPIVPIQKKSGSELKIKKPKSPKVKGSVPAAFSSGFTSPSQVESILMASDNISRESMPFPRSGKPKIPKKKIGSKKSRFPKGGKKAAMMQRSFSTFVYKILKQVHPDLGISNKAMAIMNGISNDVLDRIIKEVKILTNASHLSSVSSRQIMFAVRVMLPGELAKHAVNEGTKAVEKYQSAVNGGSKAVQDGGMKAAKVSIGPGRSVRAGLTFPVGRLHRLLSVKLRMRTGVSASIFTAAVMEYLCAEVR